MIVFTVLIAVHYVVLVFFFFQAEDGIRDLVRSRGLGDVYKRQTCEDVFKLLRRRDGRRGRRSGRSRGVEADGRRGLSLIHI